MHSLEVVVRAGAQATTGTLQKVDDTKKEMLEILTSSRNHLKRPPINSMEKWSSTLTTTENEGETNHSTPPRYVKMDFPSYPGALIGQSGSIGQPNSSNTRELHPNSEFPWPSFT